MYNPGWIIFTAILVFQGMEVSAQALHQTQRRPSFQPSVSKRFADESFNNFNFKAALDNYLMLWKKDTANINLNHRIGLCYLNTEIDKAKAISYLEFVTSNKNIDENAWYDLGRAYQYAYRFDDAIAAYWKFIEVAKGRDENYIPAVRQIEMCRNAKELIRNPLNVTYTNMGPDFNSPGPDYNPFVSREGNFIVFTSKRPGNLGNFIDFDGFNTSDAFFSDFKNGSWKKPKRFPGNINTALIEETTGLTQDGNRMFVFMINDKALNDLYYCDRKGRSFSKPVNLGTEVNGIESIESSGVTSPDGKYLFFSSDRGNGKSGSNLWYCRMLPTGKWGPAVDAGPVINTPFDEDYPNFSPDGKYLFFASTGHNSMGGYDLFRSVWDPDSCTFSPPENLGYPVNTVENNMTISYLPSGRYAYVSALRPEGIGDLDLYKITFNDVNPCYLVIHAEVLNPDSTSFYAAKSEFPDLHMFAINNDTRDTAGRYLANKATGRFIAILSPGNYSLVVKCNDYQDYYFEENVLDEPQKIMTEQKKIVLQPIH